MDGPTFTAGNEGCELVAFPDSLGKPTLGRGRHVGITLGMTCTQQEADDWYSNEDYPGARSKAMIDVGAETWEQLDDVRRAALADQAFEMGEEGLAKFTKMVAAIQVMNWQTAHDECLDSLYDRQVPIRAGKIAKMLLSGEWPNG